MDLRVDATGIRNYEIIKASPSGKQCQGSIMQIRGQFPTNSHKVKDLSPTDLRDKLNLVPFFKTLSVEDRKKWLQDNTAEQELYLEDVELYVKFINIGGKFFENSLKKEDIEMLLEGNPDDAEGFWDIKDVYNLIPRKPNSKAFRHTLIFRPGNWVLDVDESKNFTNSYNGVYITLNPPTLNDGYSENKTFVYKCESDVKDLVSTIGIVTDNEPGYSNLDHILKKYKSTDEIKSIVGWFPPSLHKSLIQKLIRTRCRHVEFLGKLYDSDAVLVTSIVLLLMHPGAFVPNIQRYVTGLESATKRLAVSICEDSYFQDGNEIMGLYAASLLAQQDRSWKPSADLIERWIYIALICQRDKRIYNYDIPDFDGKIEELSPYSMSYILLSEIKSFKTDISMVGSIAQHDGMFRDEKADDYDSVMPIIHCLDHHSYTDIGHFMDYNGETFSEKFAKIWGLVTGVNPRLDKYKYYYRGYEQDPEVISIREAQRHLWINKTYTPQPRKITKSKYKFTYKLNEAWLSGLIGKLDIKIGKTNCYVVLNPNDIRTMIAVRRPSRDKNQEELTEDEKEKAMIKARELLSKEFKLKNVPQTLSELKGASIILEDDEYYVKLSGKSNYILWDDFINLSYQFDIHPDIKVDIENALIYTGTGIQNDADTIMDYIIDGLSIEILQRMLIYLNGYKSVITMYKISRDGTGQDLSVVPEDGAVHRVLSFICVLYPACLQMSPNGFEVKNGPLLWSIKDKIKAKVSNTDFTTALWKMPIQDSRTMWEHQKESLQLMVERKTLGHKGNIIYSPVGSGKTMIVMNYVRYLITNNLMPEYCVYTLPPSALESIVKEINYLKIPYRIVNMNKTPSRIKNSENLQRVNDIFPNVINIILHDQLRKIHGRLTELAPKMLFIVDEFHKTLNKTLRTSVTLETVQLAQDFVAMSGTIIKDTNADDLIQWLSLIVDYHVNEENYWTAIGALISRKFLTKIVVNREDIEIPLNDQEEKRYYSLVPKSLGGTANTIHFKDAAKVCYDAITRGIIHYATEYVKTKEKVFVVAKDVNHQQYIADRLHDAGVKNIFLINKDNSINYEHDDKRNIDVIITTQTHSAGYSLSKIRVMIQGVYFSNQATRDQLEGRLNRANSKWPEIMILTLHTGILTYIHQKYEKVRSLSKAIHGFAKDIGVTSDIPTNLM